MMKNKIIRFTSILVLFLIVSIAFFISYTNVNKKKPGYTYHFYNTDEKINLGNITLTVSNVKKYSDDEYQNIYNLSKDENEYKITVNMEIENNTNQTQNADFSRIIIEKKGWFSNISLYDFYSINKIETYLLEVAPHSTQQVIVPFTYYDYSDSPISLSEIEFWLDVYNSYPDKNIVNI